ncbi:MAG: radical SAM protein, partial [Bryobacteraceae bacterium]
VSIDGLAPEHDVRRKPATYERILKNIEGCQVNIHLTVTRQMMGRDGYLDEYMAFWCGRPEVLQIWCSLYSPQTGEQSPEILTRQDREEVTRQLKALRHKYPQLLATDDMADAYLKPPASPEHCIFSRMSVNVSADLETRVEPCIYGGNPDCSQCGCAATAGLEAVGAYVLAGPLRARHVMQASMAIGGFFDKFRGSPQRKERWQPRPKIETRGLVQIGK